MSKGSAGQRKDSGTSLKSQKTWKTRRPAPYVSRVAGCQEEFITEIRRSRSSSVISSMRFSGALTKVGFQRRRRSLAVQWGRSSERMGVRLVRYLCGVLQEEASWAGILAKKRELGVNESSSAELVDNVGRRTGFVGKIALEKVANAFGKDGGVAILSEKADFSGGEREGRVNKESAEISR